jgi:hypothetical protein
MSRLCRILAAAVVAFGMAASPAASAPPTLGATLGALWETVLETPTPQNVFAGGDPCIDLGAGVVAPFVPLGTPSLTCKVKPDTTLFITAWSSECSTVEDPPYFGRNERQLRACARAADAGITLVEITVDGQPVAVNEVETGLLTIDLPENNIFQLPAQQAFSVGHGWVTLLNPLSPGRHEIIIHVEGTYLGDPVDFTNTTTIIVQGRS